MAIKGTTAKENIAKKIIEIFGQENVREYNKKLYINTADSDGTPVQVCITMSCPKVAIDFMEAANSMKNVIADCDNAGTASQISTEELEKVADLFNKLGI